jgi:hypothetical protein
VKDVIAFAANVTKDFPISSFTEQLKLKDVALWAEESYNMSTRITYVGIQEGTKPTTNYLKAGQTAARERLALAGYRLAQALEEAFRPSTLADPDSDSDSDIDA